MRRSLIILWVVAAWLGWAVPDTVQAEYRGKISGEQFTSLVTETTSRVVVVNFWATWCGPCRQEFPALISLRKQFTDKDLLLVGISLDYNPEAVKFFVDRVGFNYPIYLDGGEIAPAFNVSAIPRLLVFADGTLKASHVGYIPEKTLNKVIRSLLDEDRKGETS